MVFHLFKLLLLLNPFHSLLIKWINLTNRLPLPFNPHHIIPIPRNLSHRHGTNNPTIFVNKHHNTTKFVPLLHPPHVDITRAYLRSKRCFVGETVQLSFSCYVCCLLHQHSLKRMNSLKKVPYLFQFVILSHYRVIIRLILLLLLTKYFTISKADFCMYYCQ